MQKKAIRNGNRTFFSRTIHDTDRELPGVGGVALLLGAFIGYLIFGASTMLAPSIAANLELGTDTATLVVTVFALGFAILLVLGGRLGDRYGRRLVFRIGLAAIAVCSAVIASSNTGWELLSLQFLQGTAAGLMLPQVLSTIQHSASFRARPHWQAGYGAAIGLGTTSGLLIAGVFIALKLLIPGWRATFLLIVVLAVITLLLSHAVPETRSASSRSDVTDRIDGVGTLLFAVGTGTLLLLITLGKAAGWSWWVFAGLIGAFAVLAAFWIWEHHQPEGQALIPPVALRERPLVVGLALSLVFFAGYGAFVYVSSLTEQTGMGQTALTAAVTLVAFFTGFILTSIALPHLARILPPKLMMYVGGGSQAVLLIGIAGTVWFGWPRPASWLMEPLLFLLGAAQALMYGPLLSTVMSAVDVRIAGLASGLFSTAQQLGNSLGVALFGLLYASVAAGSEAAALPVCLLAQALLAIVFIAFVGTIRSRRTESSKTTPSDSKNSAK